MSRVTYAAHRSKIANTSSLHFGTHRDAVASNYAVNAREHVTPDNVRAGALVCRNSDSDGGSGWASGDVDGVVGGTGVIVSIDPSDPGRCRVSWRHSSREERVHNIGLDRRYELHIYRYCVA